MDLLHTREAAKQSLHAAGDTPKKLATIYIGVIVALSLLISVLNYVTGLGIDSTSGLSGIGLRSVLATVQSLLVLSSNLLLPFWEIGFLFAMLIVVRKQKATPGSLLEGFRRFGPFLRLFLLQLLIFFGLAIAALQIAALILAPTPLADNAIAYMNTLPMQDNASMEQALLTEEGMRAFQPLLIGVYGLFFLIYGIVSIPLFYKFRMATYAIVDGCPRARAALSVSTRLMMGNRWSLFLLDLRFWWFYAAQVLIALIPNIPVFLVLLNIPLPIDENIITLVSYLAALVLQFFLFRQFGCQVHATYAHCYEALFPTAAPPEPAISPDPVPREP